MRKHRIGLGSLMEVPSYSLEQPKAEAADLSLVDKFRLQTLKVALGSAKIASKAAHIVRETPAFIRDVRDNPGMFSTGFGMTNSAPQLHVYEGLEYPELGENNNG